MSPPPITTTLWSRLGDALRRRAVAYWSCWWSDRPRAPVEAAFDWLTRSPTGPWLPAIAGQTEGDPVATGLGIDVLYGLGIEQPLPGWREWLQTQSLAAHPDTEAVLSLLARAQELSSARLAECCQTLLDRGLDQPAADILRARAREQRADGAVPALSGSRWVCSVGLAHLAGLWQRVDAPTAAGRAIDCLLRHQKSSGAFPGAWGPAAGVRRHEEPTRTVLYFLKAVQRQVEGAFGPEATTVPDTIDPTDGRVDVVRRWLQLLPPDARVVDLGCGKGRYERLFGGEFPGLRFTGVDASPAMLACLPPGMTACQASLLRLPLAHAAFDAAVAIESLEHALAPARAVEEMCRIVRPGGRVLLIDKHRRKQILSRHDPWERWFLPEELRAWLARWCDDVHVEPVSHREGRPAADLFLAARGTRRG